MALEIVEAVRKAEGDAEQAEKMAAEERERVLSAAKQEAQKAEENQEAEAQAQARALVENAQREGEQILRDEQAHIQVELERLRSMASCKEADAVKSILSEFV